MATWPLQTRSGREMGVALRRRFAALIDRLESRLESERERIGLWLPVALGLGIALWFALPGPAAWVGVVAACGAVAGWGALLGWHRRSGRILIVGAAVVAAGLALIWTRAALLDAPVLARPVTTEFSARIERVESLPAREAWRLVVRPVGRPDLPPRLRLTLAMPAAGDVVRVPLAGESVGLRARLMPPPAASLPGGYDFSQRAWFDGLGGVGTILGQPVYAARPASSEAGLRARLTTHVQQRVGGSEGGIAAALVTGDRGAISEEDAEAMRRSGLAHLLSISGLHVTAVVGFAMLALMRLLALSPALALGGRVPLIAAAGAALAGVGYTLLTGAEVPTVRSCIAALLILGAMMLGREALTLRLVAAGALIVMIWRPEAVVGPSFQLSFAAVTAIVALHENRRLQAFMMRREEGRLRRLGRGLVSLLLTGLIVEVVLAPIALFHFHKAGLYGALANMVAIPLTTFVVMPAEALALAADALGLGAPFWWVARQALAVMLGVAHGVADAPGAVVALPVFPASGFALVIGGGLWLLLWTTRWRWAGAVPVAIGALLLAFQPRPDLLVTGDGRHLAARVGEGRDYALLRAGAGDFVRDSLSEAAGIDGDLLPLAQQPGVECNRDFCRWQQASGTEKPPQIILASRGQDMVDVEQLAAACAAADIVVTDRWLPASCRARWLTIDRDTLETSGGLALYFADRRVITARRDAAHPWRDPERVSGNDEAVPTADLAR